MDRKRAFTVRLPRPLARAWKQLLLACKKPCKRGNCAHDELDEGLSARVTPVKWKPSNRRLRPNLSKKSSGKLGAKSRLICNSNARPTNICDDERRNRAAYRARATRRAGLRVVRSSLRQARLAKSAREIYGNIGACNGLSAKPARRQRCENYRRRDRGLRCPLRRRTSGVMPQSVKLVETYRQFAVGLALDIETQLG